ncbi:hypothetical protein PoB_004428300 [Plakobranchus ocellatus]|uniref:CUB domain-containing protein n=1 Tax=Plakobranchus ocellatus TaxID=259542 RepID=A0AAV4BF37_9GAST|nr:hypothetical protein PoB_004428300 [Plakobranchus ocellatus]
MIPKWFHARRQTLTPQRNLFCKVTFKSHYDKDGVKLVFDRVDLEPPRISGDYSTCEDKIVVYDGPSQSDRMLATLCGNRVVTIESTGNKLLLVFSSDGDNSDRHLGYTVTFSRIDSKHYVNVFR